MLTEITLKNFKCFKRKTHFPLSKINLLTGVNGGGKSSLFQALLLFKRSKLIANIVNLNSDYVELGTLEDVKNSETPLGTPVEIEFIFGEYPYHFSFATADFLNQFEKSIKVAIGDRVLHIFRVERKVLSDDILFMDEGDVMMGFSRSIHYISADRIAPQNFYLYTNNSLWEGLDKQGKSAPSMLYEQKDQLVYEKLCLGQDSRTVLQQTEEWLNAIFDGAKVELKAGRDTISLSYNTKQTPKRYKPSNVGFGYSYILPIIVSGLIAKRREILIVENPEAHLHPAAQSKLTKFLAKVASCGVQVFIETHSEHILNALRVVSVSKDYDIKNTDISVLYFQNNENQLVMQIPINAKGGIDYWPENFFDQEEQDLSEIFKLTRKK